MSRCDKVANDDLTSASEQFQTVLQFKQKDIKCTFDVIYMNKSNPIHNKAFAICHDQF